MSLANLLAGKMFARKLNFADINASNNWDVASADPKCPQSAGGSRYKNGRIDGIKLKVNPSQLMNHMEVQQLHRHTSLPICAASNCNKMKMLNSLVNCCHLTSSSVHGPTQLQSSSATIPLTGSFTLILHTHRGGRRRDKVQSANHTRASTPYPPHLSPSHFSLRRAPCASPPPCGECLPCSSRSTCRSSRRAGGGSW